MKLLIFLVFPLFISFFYYIVLKNDIVIGGIERVPHPHFSSIQGDITKSTDEFTRSNEWFVSHGVNCHGWMYIPTESMNNPDVIIIMSHGFGGQKDMGLEKYARRFVSYGEFGVFTIDYRNFGGSDGDVRNLVSPLDHVEDIHSAIRHIRKKYPSSKIALWGSSLGGGHVLSAGGEYKEKHGDNALVGIISQVPHIDGLAASIRNVKRRGFYFLSKSVIAALLDVTLTAFGFGPVMINIFCVDDKKLGMMSISESEYALYFSKHPNIYLGGWKNLVPARIALKIRKYSPIKMVDQIEVPVLYISAENDILCPHHQIERAYKISKAKHPKSDIIPVKGIGHFGVYSDEIVEATSKRVVEFLNINKAD